MSRMQRFKGGVWQAIGAISPSLELALRKRFSRSHGENWGYRTRVARSSSDNAFIPRVPEAGRLVDGFQIMHNGLRVLAGSYYGDGPITLLRKNKGVHEPQEERAFQEVLKAIKPGGVILELGAYWAFYSMWFCKEVPHARAFMVEPLKENLRFGERNFAANGFTGHFTQAYVGAKTSLADDGIKVICVDGFLEEHGIERLAILHCDIQGFELEMLHGAGHAIEQRRIDWLFISTHSDELHRECEAFLSQRGFVTLASVPMSESFSVDGVLVMRAQETSAIPALTISRRRQAT